LGWSFEYPLGCAQSDGLDLARDGPHKAGELAGDGHDDLVAIHATCGEPPELCTQSQLRFPGDG
jgi:hypothetical protein